MTDKWHKGNLNGPNEKLVELAQKLAEAAKLGINEKLNKLKSYTAMEAKRLNHPAATAIADEIDKIELKING